MLSFTGLALNPTEVDLIESFATKGKANSIAVWGTTNTGTYLFHGIVENITLKTACYLCAIYPTSIAKRLWVYKVTILDVTGTGAYSIESDYFDF